MKFTLIGISGSDIYDENKKLTLALLWQMMRAYTVKVKMRIFSRLSFKTQIFKVLVELGDGKPVTDNDILEWANSKLSSDHKIGSFKDPALTTSMPIYRLINAIVPNTIDISLVNTKRYLKNSGRASLDINYRVKSLLISKAPVAPFFGISGILMWKIFQSKTDIFMVFDTVENVCKSYSMMAPSFTECVIFTPIINHFGQLNYHELCDQWKYFYLLAKLFILLTKLEKVLPIFDRENLLTWVAIKKWLNETAVWIFCIIHWGGGITGYPVMNQKKWSI